MSYALLSIGCLLREGERFVAPVPEGIALPSCTYFCGSSEPELKGRFPGQHEWHDYSTGVVKRFDYKNSVKGSSWTMVRQTPRFVVDPDSHDITGVILLEHSDSVEEIPEAPEPPTKTVRDLIGDAAEVTVPPSREQWLNDIRKLRGKQK